MDTADATTSSSQTAPTLVLKRIKDIRAGPDGCIDIIARDETGGDIVIRIGHDDQHLISKRSQTVSVGANVGGSAV